MPPKTISKKSSDAAPASSEATPTALGKRKAANFSTILTHLATQRTRSQTEVVARQIKDFASGSSPKSKGIDTVKPKRKILSTSQNHIISDKYLSEMLEKSITRIQQYIISGDGAKIDLATRQEQAIKDFFKKIFHHTEKEELKNSLDGLQKYLHQALGVRSLSLLRNLRSLLKLSKMMARAV